MNGENLIGLAIGTMAIGAALKGLEKNTEHHHKKHFHNCHKIYEGNRE